MDPDWISINLHAKDSRMLEAGKSLSPPPQIDDVRFSHINLRARRAWNDKFHCFVDASMSSRRSLTSTFKTFHIDVGGIFTYFPIKSDDERGLTMKNRCLLKLFVETFSLRFLTRVKKKVRTDIFTRLERQTNLTWNPHKFLVFPNGLKYRVDARTNVTMKNHSTRQFNFECPHAIASSSSLVDIWLFVPVTFHYVLYEESSKHILLMFFSISQNTTIIYIYDKQTEDFSSG